MMRFNLGHDPKAVALACSRLNIQASALERWKLNAATLVDEEAKDDNEILIYGPIVSDGDVGWYREWFGDESVMSNRVFKEELNAIDGDVTIRFNSVGGNAWEAAGMVQTLDERRDRNIDGIVDGLAASAASVVMAAIPGKVTISQMGEVMIHKTHSIAYGNADDFTKLANLLGKKDLDVAKIYARRMEKKPKEVIDLLGDETWYNGQEAVDIGLVDEVFEPEPPGGDEDEQRLLQKAQFQIDALVAVL